MGQTERAQRYDNELSPVQLYTGRARKAWMQYALAPTYSKVRDNFPINVIELPPQDVLYCFGAGDGLLERRVYDALAKKSPPSQIVLHEILHDQTAEAAARFDDVPSTIARTCGRIENGHVYAPRPDSFNARKQRLMATYVGGSIGQSADTLATLYALRGMLTKGQYLLIDYTAAHANGAHADPRFGEQAEEERQWLDEARGSAMPVLWDKAVVSHHDGYEFLYIAEYASGERQLCLRVRRFTPRAFWQLALRAGFEVVAAAQNNGWHLDLLEAV